MANAQIGVGAAAAAHRASLAPEDESEWEYEYSNTETETFYVTLDLSTADFTAPHRNVISNIRTDYHDKPLTETERVRHRSGDPNSNGGDGDGEDDDEQGVQQLNRSPAAEDNLARNSAEPDIAEASEKVQIMELHSPNPVISYKGRVYQGQWSRHVGTELLMTRHDDDNPLPAVRHLDHGVDLLAASCARITVTQKELEHKDPNSTQQNANFTPEEREALSKIPKPDTKPTLARTNQGNFLAKLIALKKRKGEKDEVPVLVNGHVRDLWVKGSHRGRGRGRPRGRRRGRGKGAGILHQEVFPGRRPTLESITELPDSTPTPKRWDDLSNANGSTDGGEGGSSDVENENAMEVDEGSDEAGYSDDGSIAAEEEEEEEEEENGQEDEDGSGVDGQSDDEDSDGDEMDVDED